ncbi:SBBP repeat-containing protein [Archangium violaceum]|uniref:SBBP repeat-containing protein n=1 Tax=Archangium violaceum TaxID=83451 RepID=UPI002B2F9B65|nr:SBBP repeat-containing protein [Archangium gephyra]
MRTLKTIRSTILTSGLALLAVPGCQGEEPTAAPSPDESVTRTQAVGCEVNQVPVMTSNTSPSGIATRSGVFSAAYEAWQAFDGTNSMWISAVKQTPAWLAYEWTDGPRTISRYALTYANGSIITRAPKSWTFEAWNGTAWVVLDTRTNETGWSNERREYAVASPAPYARYRLHFTEDNDARTGVEVISLGKVELMGCPQQLWTNFLGAPGQWTRLNDLVGDPSGRTFSTGMTTAPVGGPMVGPMDAFLNAYNSAGSLLWSQQIGVPGTATLGYAITQSLSMADIYVAGFTDGGLHGNTKMGTRDVFLARYDVSGNRVWTRQLGAPGFSTEGYGVGLDTVGNIFVVGDTNGNLDGNTRIGRYDAFVTMYDSTGARQWTRTLGAAGADTIARRAVSDSGGNVYVAGWTTGGLDGNVRVGTQDFFITKFSSVGVKLWTRQLSGAGGGAFLYGAALDGSGNIYVTGYASGSMDGNPVGSGVGTYLVKYDPSGNRQWVRQFGFGSSAWGMGLVIKASDVFLVGHGMGDVTSESSSSGAYHTYVARYDTSGTRHYLIQQPAARLGSTDKMVTVYGFSVDQYGYVYIGGFVEGNYGGQTLMGNPDSYVTKLRLP